MTNFEYTIKTFETKGLHIFYPHDQPATHLSTAIIKGIKKQNKVNIHLVLFVLRYNSDGYAYPKEIETIERIFKSFNCDMRRISALVVTHCDLIVDKKRSEIKMSYDQLDVLYHVYKNGSIFGWISEHCGSASQRIKTMHGKTINISEDRDMLSMSMLYV